MTKPLTAKRLAEIKARREAATVGEWTYSVDSVDGRPCTLSSTHDGEEVDIAVFEQWDASIYEEEMKANAEFLFNAPTDTDALIAEVGRLKEALEEIAVEAGKVDISNWPAQQQICQSIAWDALGKEWT